MKINKQLFEDVLSGKLKGTFVLRSGKKITSDNLQHTPSGWLSETHPYLLVFNSLGDCPREWAYKSNGGYMVSEGEFCLDIIDFIPDTDMKENELTIEIPDGKIVDWEESKKQNKIVLKDKPLTYEDICKKLFKKGYYYTCGSGCIGQRKVFVEDFLAACPNYASTSHQLECILAKNKLATVAKYLNDGWKPNKGDTVFVLTFHGSFENSLVVGKYYFGIGENQIIFKTQKAAQQAIEILGKETIKLALEPLGV